MDHNQFASPFSWRYGSAEMRQLWGEVEKRRLWRRVWVALARAEMQAGLVSAEQVEDLTAHRDDIDIERAEAIEAEIHHDLMAEVRTYAEQCLVGGGIIHLGATSADIEDNADALRLRSALQLVETRLVEVLTTLSALIRQYSHMTSMAFTHLQPAEPTTVGYRLSLYAQDLLEDFDQIRRVKSSIRGKGLKGAVGTSASYGELLQGTSMTAAELERLVMQELSLEPFPAAGQTYPRKQDWRVVSALSGLGATLYRFAFDLRVLQSPLVGEWGEPFQKSQVGSSAMPFKRNPINAEKLDSLGRLLQSLTQVAWDNAAHSLLERTLDDSANRREMLPVAFLTADEMLRVTGRILRGLRVDENAIQRNVEKYGLFAATERVLMAAGRAGADRQMIHEHLRELSMSAWAVVSGGGANPLAELVKSSSVLQQYLTAEQLEDLMDASEYVGLAPQRALSIADQIDSVIS